MLEAFGISPASQTLVFSQTSFQAPHINMHNPRAVFFDDTVAVGWVRGGEVLEVAVQDPRQGAVFYDIEQKPAEAPQLVRNNQCLACHLTWETLGVPGFMTGSMYPLPDDPNAYANGFTTIHGSPLEQRWGGWWVTGDTGGARHMGNVPVMPVDKGKARPNPQRHAGVGGGHLRPEGLSGRLERRRGAAGAEPPDADAEPSDARGLGGPRRRRLQPSADADARVTEAAADLVSYMLFVDEAPFAGPVKGHGGYAEWFAAQGPRDSEGPVAPRVRPRDAAVQVPVQLPDLLRGVRRAARHRQARGLRADVGRAERQGAAGPRTACDCAGRSAGDRRDPARHQDRPSRVLPLTMRFPKPTMWVPVAGRRVPDRRRTPRARRRGSMRTASDAMRLIELATTRRLRLAAPGRR